MYMWRAKKKARRKVFFPSPQRLMWLMSHLWTFYDGISGIREKPSSHGVTRLQFFLKFLEVLARSGLFQ